MSNLHNFVIAIGMSFLVSTAVLLVILQPLKRVLACRSSSARCGRRSTTTRSSPCARRSSHPCSG